MQSPIRVAAVSYLNTAPLIEGLDACADLEVERLVPSRIVDRLTQTGPDRVDLGLVSVIDAARTGEDLALLSCGMIGCEGPTLTVRLYASIDPARITRLHADSDSHTSVALAQVILHERYGVRPEVVPFNARECASDGADWPEAALLIGDKVVASSPPAVRATTQIDLGSAWHELTGLPFVYALWMCRYVGELLRYEVGPREREAVRVFLHKASELGLAPRVEPVWADEPAARVA